MNNAPDKDEAIKFVDFLLSQEGKNIFRKNGQDPLTPASSEQSERVPGATEKIFEKMISSPMKDNSLFKWIFLALSALVLLIYYSTTGRNVYSYRR